LAFDAEYFGPVDLPVQDSEELSKKEENAFKAELNCYTVIKSLIKRDIIVY
jgi:hypothetical protein